jgi:hypothetical protein
VNRSRILELTGFLLLCLGTVLRADEPPPLDGPPTVRALLGDSQLVLRGRVLDQEHVSGGMWHRFQVEEVVWAQPAEPGVAALISTGSTVRLFAHGEGVPEGACLRVGQELLVGASRLPPPGRAGLPPLLRNLWEGFQADGPGDWPLLVSPDGIFPSGDPELAAELAGMVRGLRDPAQGAAARSSLLLDMANHPSAAVREEAVRRLADPALELDRAGAERALATFQAELDGPAHPAVLSAHLELLGALNPPGSAPLLRRLVLAAPRLELAFRAGEALAEKGSPGDFEELARSYPEESPEGQVRILHALAAGGSEEHLSIFKEALSAADPPVRVQAVLELAGHPAPWAGDLLWSARLSPEPEMRKAVGVALERRQAEEGAGEPHRAAPPLPGERLSDLLRLARRRLSGGTDDRRTDR